MCRVAGWLFATLALTILGCGRGASPSAPSPAIDNSAIIPVAPFGLSATFTPTPTNPELFLSWMHPGGASGYLIESGFAAGSSDIFAGEPTPLPTYRWANPPARPIFVRVRARNSAGVSAPSAEIRAVLFDPRDYIEAIFLGSGPLIPLNGQVACPSTGRLWSAFRFGTTVAITFGSSVSAANVDTVREAAEGINPATNGLITIAFATAPDPYPVPLPNQITVATHPRPSDLGCTNDLGCSMPRFSAPGLLTTGRAVLAPSVAGGAYVHEAIGHDAFGMCHIERDLIGGPLSIMANGGPTALSRYDLEATRAVYSSGLSPGARRSDFARVGLVRP
ncbi:MAG: fibronectin type III domain-containing protein [Vicinamibacterales bacterium]